MQYIFLFPPNKVPYIFKPYAPAQLKEFPRLNPTPLRAPDVPFEFCLRDSLPKVNWYLEVELYTIFKYLSTSLIVSNFLMQQPSITLPARKFVVSRNCRSSNRCSASSLETSLYGGESVKISYMTDPKAKISVQREGNLMTHIFGGQECRASSAPNPSSPKIVELPKSISFASSDDVITMFRYEVSP
jgi:hypothetical protein